MRTKSYNQWYCNLLHFFINMLTFYDREYYKWRKIIFFNFFSKIFITNIANMSLYYFHQNDDMQLFSITVQHSDISMNLITSYTFYCLKCCLSSFISKNMIWQDILIFLSFLCMYAIFPKTNTAAYFFVLI